MSALLKTRFAYVGTYTTQARGARGTGLHAFEVDPDTGAWTQLQTLGGLVNPSFLVMNADQTRLYAVHGDEEHATAFALDTDTGAVRILNQAATGGRNGVRQALDPSGRFMVVANYGSGTVAVLAIRPDGSLADQHQLVALEGELGPHRREQASSRPHDICFDPTGRFVVVPDKGLDRSFVFRFDPAAGLLSAADPAFTASRSGAAPRHLGFHPTLPVLWVLNELDSTVVTCRWDAATGAMTPVQLLPTLPEAYTGDNTTAEIAVAPDGRFVYCSNRAHASVAVYAVDPDSGALRAVAWEPTRGAWPRFIALEPGGARLHAANERSDTITTFDVHEAAGRLSYSGQTIEVASPATIAFSTAPRP